MNRHPAAQPQIAILAYGSLIAHPGASLAAIITRRRDCRTPFPVEYGRASPRWNGGPVLTLHPRGGPVAGQLLYLRSDIDLGAAIDLLSEREGLESARGVIAVDGFGGGHVVLAACLDRNLPAPDMNPTRLAERAIASAAGGGRNGIAYLRQAIDSGIVTPRTDAYAAAILAQTGARSLVDAERLVA